MINRRFSVEPSTKELRSQTGPDYQGKAIDAGAEFEDLEVRLLQELKQTVGCEIPETYCKE